MQFLKNTFNSILKKCQKKPSKVISSFGFFVLCAVFYLNLTSDTNYASSYLPHAQIITLAVDFTCIIFAAITFFGDKISILYYLGMGALSFLNVANGNELLGATIMMVNCILYLCDGNVIRHPKKTTILFFAIWTLECLFMIPHGIKNFIYFITVTIFIIATLLSCVYLFKLNYEPKSTAHKILYSKSPTQIPLIIETKDYTERQIFCIKELYENPNIQIAEIAQKLNISGSVIKKEMSAIYNKLNISNINDLKIVLANSQLIIR